MRVLARTPGAATRTIGRLPIPLPCNLADQAGVGAEVIMTNKQEQKAGSSQASSPSSRERSGLQGSSGSSSPSGKPNPQQAPREASPQKPHQAQPQAPGHQDGKAAKPQQQQR